MAKKLVCTCDLCGRQIYDDVYNLAYVKTNVDNPEDTETYEFDDETDSEFVNPDICADCYHNIVIPGICHQLRKNTSSEKSSRSKIKDADVKIMLELKAEGLSNKKISEQIGCSEQTVANYLAKAREEKDHGGDGYKYVMA